MCGIVGITGKDNAVEILINGLEKLEYRGYDSAGIYVNNGNGNDFLVKVKGRIADLKDKVPADVKGTAGIGHTRWATHGIPSETNAHPHISENGRFYLVHNGVIGNFKELKAKYLSDVHFASETDTEVVVQMVEHFSNEGLETKEAFKKTISVLDESSSYAFLLMDREDPETLYVAKSKSPLLIGVGEGFNARCSDSMAMLKETHEQPAVMRKLATEYFDENGNIKIEADLLKAIEASDRIYIVAAGTSYHAGLVGRELFEKLAKIPTEVHVSSEFGYNMPLLSEKPFFIYLTQSGETADSRQVLVQTNELGYPSLTITNVPNSTLSREASYTLLLHAGPEIAVASTKAYTAQIAVEAILAKKLGEERGIEAAKDFDIHLELAKVANAMQTMVDEKHEIEELTEKNLKTTRNAFYIGRSIDYDTAIEAALKLKEVSYVQTEGFASGELKHGTIALIEEGTPVIAIITDEKTAAHTRSNVQEVIARGANVITIVSQSLSNAGDQIVLPDVHPLLTPLVSIVPAQLLAYYTSKQRGYDVDKPRNLAKSVTVE